MQKTFQQDVINRKVIKNTGQLPMYLIENHHEGIVSRKKYNAVQAEMARRMDAIVGAGYPYIVAQEPDGTIAGYAYASSYRARLGYRMTVENSVYVAAGRQGQGIGTALLGRLIAMCEERGFRQMIAVIGEPTNTASIRLHEKFGFQLVGIFRGIAWKHGRWLDTVQMQRPLGAGNNEPPHDS